MLNNLGIRQKLGLLLVLPLFAVVCTIIPFTVERVDDARAAAVTAQSARLARQVGGLVQNLQQERVLALAYVVLPSTDRSALVTQQRVVDDSVVHLRTGAGNHGGGGNQATHAEGGVDADLDADVAQALDRVAGLREQRRLVLSRSAGTSTVFRAYREVIQALLDALHLNTRGGVDAVGLRQLATLDALLRANQAASDVAAGLVIAAADRGTGAPLLAAAVAAEQQLRERFRRLAPGHESALLDLVEQGPSGQRIAAVTTRASGTAAPNAKEEVATALAIANTYGLLRQIVESRIATDIANAADGRETDARSAALGVGLGAVVMLVLVISLSVRVSQSIAAPLRRLSTAAAAVADIASAELVRVDDADDAASRPSRLAAVNIRGQHEIGELAAAFNRVQATAALLLERQVTTRRNVAVMFANIARRTQSLVIRQLSLIDTMERNEQDAQVLENLYRLDHLTTRLRRSADSLLVVSGNRDKELVAPTPLVTVIRAAAGEIEGFQAVRLGQVCDIVIAADLVADLRLLLAELLENATAFSPPGTLVEISAELGDGCRITIVDFGIGMPPARMWEENRRIVERPRLDVAPTEVLGLFVVGRLARRHGLTVRLEPTAGQGVTATVLIPPRLCSVPRPPTANQPAIQPAVAVTALSELAAGPFGWFADPEDGNRSTNGHHAPPLAAAPVVPDRPVAAPPTPTPTPTNGAHQARSRNGLNRRTPGTFASAFETRPATSTPPRLRDAEAEAAQLTAFAQAVEQAGHIGRHHAPAAEPGTGRHQLTRRTPGAHLAASARPSPAQTRRRHPAHANPPVRDARSEQAALDGFVEGLARAAHSLNELDSHDRKGQR